VRLWDNAVMSDAFGTQFIERLQRLLGPGGVITELDEMARHVEEPRGRYHRRPLAVVRPASTQQVAAVVVHCRRGRCGDRAPGWQYRPGGRTVRVRVDRAVK
jgi:hypothetical protein